MEKRYATISIHLQANPKKIQSTRLLKTISMLVKLNSIIIYALAAFFLALLAYPPYIALLRKLKIGKTIRETAMTGEKAVNFIELHKHKSGTPNLGG